MKKFLIALTIIVVTFHSTYGDNENQNESTEIEVEKIVITASRMAQYRYRVASNITIIDSDDIASSNAQTIADILKEHLGVHVYDNSSTKTAVLDIRGFGDTASRNVLILVNDRKINNIDISGPDVVRIPLEAVERIEIIRGAGSVLYGDNAVGGVVNIITKQGKGKLNGRVGSFYGSYKTVGGHTEVSGSRKFEILHLPNDISYYLYYKHHDTGGYRENSELYTQDYNGRFVYKLSDKLSVDLDTGWHKDDYGLPGGLSATNLRVLGRKGSSTPDDFASTKDRYAKLALDINPWPEDFYLGNFLVDFYYRNRDVYDSFLSFGAPGFNTKRAIDTFGITGKYTFNRPIFNKEVNFVTGIDYYDHENDILGSGTNPDDLTISKEEFGVFGYAQFEALDNLFVNAGTRYHEANYAFSQRNVAVDERQDPSEWVSGGGLKYEYAKGSNVHLNVQQTFRFLATDEWYSSFTGTLDTSLKQQTGIQYEIGLKHNFNDKVVISVTPYLMDINNEIFFDPSTFTNSNYDKTRRFGVEVGKNFNVLNFIDIPWVDKLEFFSNYTFQKPQFGKGANDGKDIPMAPRHQASHGLTTEFLKHYRLSLVGRYVGSRFAINDTGNTTPPIKPYYVMDTKLSYQRDHLELYFGLNNLFNEKYFTYVVGTSSKSYYPAPDRNFTFGANLRF